VALGPGFGNAHFENQLDGRAVRLGWSLASELPTDKKILRIGRSNPKVGTPVPDRLRPPVGRALMHALDISFIHAGIWPALQPLCGHAWGKANKNGPPVDVMPLRGIQIGCGDFPTYPRASHFKPGVLGP